MWLFLGKKYDSEMKFSKMLQNLFGYGRHHSLEVCCNLGISPKVKLKDLKLYLETYKSANYVKIFQKKLEDNIKQNKEYLFDNDLKKVLNNRLEFLKKIKNRRGVRLSLKLPVRGQRTQTNAKTVKKFKGFY